jgi:hypothetical protein
MRTLKTLFQVLICLSVPVIALPATVYNYFAPGTSGLEPTVFNCDPQAMTGFYANLNACLDAAKTFVTTNEVGSGKSALVLIPQGTFALTAPYTLINGMRVRGVTPRIQVVAGTMPENNMILNGGTVIDCGAAADCFNGGSARMRSIEVSQLAFQNYTGWALDFGGDSGLEGPSFSLFHDLYAIGGTTVNTTTGGFRFYNLQEIQCDRLYAYNINTGLALITQGGLGNYGNFTCNDVYIRPYTKSAANGNNALPGAVVEALTPTSGSEHTLNNVTLNHFHVQDTGVGDGTGTSMLVHGDTVGAGVTGFSGRDMDLEGSGLYGLQLTGGSGKAVTASQFNITTTAGNTNDISIGANVWDNVFSCSRNCVLGPLAGAYNDNLFFGIINTAPTYNSAALKGEFMTFQDDVVHVATDVLQDGFGNPFVYKYPVNTFTSGSSISSNAGRVVTCLNRTTGSAPWTVTLQSSPATGAPAIIKDCKGDAAAGNITVVPAAGTLDGAANYVINTNYGTWFGVYNGTQWSTVAANTTLLAGTTASIGGSLLAAGGCTSGTVTVTGATTAMVAVSDPNTYPGDGLNWSAQVTSANTVTVRVCAVLALTPTASTYNVRVLQ